MTVAPGHERWDVKTLSDPLASQVSKTPAYETVSRLVGLVAPGRDLTVRTPLEERLVQVKAYVQRFHLEADGDIHVVISEDEGGLITMIAEIPDPKLCPKNPHAPAFAAARASFVQLYGQPTPQKQCVHGKVKVIHTPVVKAQHTFVGVAFFDHLHGQDGVAPNGVEIHPVLEFK